MEKSKQPVQGFNDISERLQTTQQQLATSKKELADAYESSAKHARALFDYIEKTKEVETRLHECNLTIDAANNEKENLKLRMKKLQSDCDAKSEAFATLTQEYRSLELSYRELEKKLRDQKKTVYQANEQSSSFERQREQMELQIFKSAKIINDLNDEIALLQERIRESQSNDKKRQRNLSDISITPPSPDSFVSPSLLDAAALCAGMYEKPPIAKHRILVCFHSDNVNSSFC